jgi:hypothetical protein
MSFHLRPSHAFGKELRHLVRRELRLALEGLSGGQPDHTAAYEVRKRLKKIRAVVRLLRHDLGSHYAADKTGLRRAAHRLAALRDAESATETLAGLRARYRRRLAHAATRAAQRTLRGDERQVERDSREGLTVARSELQRVRQPLLGHLRRVHGFATVRTGLTRGYRRAKRTMNSLTSDATAVRLHEWRRRVKDHWYQVRLFDVLSRRARARGEGLRRLETRLGEAHNLSMLRAIILKTPGRFGDAKWRAELLDCIAKTETRLRRQAFSLGAGLFAASASSFHDEVTRWRP